MKIDIAKGTKVWVNFKTETMRQDGALIELPNQTRINDEEAFEQEIRIAMKEQLDIWVANDLSVLVLADSRVPENVRKTAFQ